MNHHRHSNHQYFPSAPKPSFSTSALGSVDCNARHKSRANTSPRSLQGYEHLVDQHSNTFPNSTLANGPSVFDHSVRNGQGYPEHPSRSHRRHQELQIPPAKVTQQPSQRVSQALMGLTISADPYTDDHNGATYNPFTAVGHQFTEYHDTATIVSNHQQYFDRPSGLPTASSHTRPLLTATDSSGTSQWVLERSHQTEPTHIYTPTSSAQFSRQPKSYLHELQFHNLEAGIGSCDKTKASAVGPNQDEDQDNCISNFPSHARPYWPARHAPSRYDCNINTTRMSMMTSYQNHQESHPRRYRSRIPTSSESISMESLDGTASLNSPCSIPRLDDDLPVPPYVALSIPTSTTSGTAQFLTRSSNQSLNVRQSTEQATSNGSLSPSSGQPYLSNTSSGDVARCHICGEIASRATKLNDRKSNLKRHIRDKHERAEGNKPMCLEPGCGKTFERSDYVLRHRRKSHGLDVST